MTLVTPKRPKKGGHSDHRKLTLRIRRPLLEAFNSTVENACLRRDQYLHAVLQHELPRLGAEISVPNSEAASNHVAKQLRNLPDLHPVSIALPRDTAQRLDDICRRKRIVRDAFFNRLFLLLSAPSDQLDYHLSLREEDDDWSHSDNNNSWWHEVWVEHRNDGPSIDNLFERLSSPQIDPLWALHTAFEIRADRKETIERRTDPQTGETQHYVLDFSDAPAPIPGVYSWPLRPSQQEDLMSRVGI